MTMRAQAGLLLALVGAAVPAVAQNASALRAQANTESNQEKQVILLCKAADLEPKNKEYRKDCDVQKQALIASDKQSLKTALDANDAGQTAKAKRYAKYVSSLDPDTHRQAEQLLNKLNTPEAPVQAAAPAPAVNQSATLLSQATGAFESGNLAAAKSAAQGVTDASLKPAANRLISDIDRYSNFVASGQRQEQAKDYAQSERSYQAALDINSHVGSDDLNGKLQHVRQLASAPAPSAPAAAAPAPTVVASNTPPKNPAGDARAQKQAQPDISPDERKRRLLDESAAAMERNDLNLADRKFKEVLSIDPNNAQAKQGVAAIIATLSRDPVRLEKTLREAILAFYGSHFDDAESGLNRYLGADGGKRKGAAYFYLGATEATLAMLDETPKRKQHQKQAQANFKQARSEGYQPVTKYVSAKILDEWKQSTNSPG